MPKDKVEDISEVVPVPAPDTMDAVVYLKSRNYNPIEVNVYSRFMNTAFSGQRKTLDEWDTVVKEFLARS